MKLRFVALIVLFAFVLAFSAARATTARADTPPLPDVVPLASPDDFVITVKTNNPGPSLPTQFTIPTFPGEAYNYNVDCDNDGTNEASAQTGDYTCNYASAGTYTIRIKDNSGAGTGFPRIYFNNAGDRLKLLTIEQWGTGKWTSMASAFYGCSYLAGQASDSPDLSGVTDMSFMFYAASVFNQAIGDWNTASVTNMSFMFAWARAFNQDIGGWNTASVTNMNSMFYYASAFNQDIGSWNTANVANMRYLFGAASAFNGNIGSWDTANVTTMQAMFSGTAAFNQDIGGWNTASVTDMSYMFGFTGAFNQYIGDWNTGNVSNMSWMFWGASAFNQPIGNWNTASVTDMSYMFYLSSVFNQDIGNWNTANVRNMSWMFANSFSFNQDIGSWNTASLVDTSNMFANASAFNQDIGAWDVSALQLANGMFTGVKLSQANYDGLLIGWSTQTLHSGVVLDAGNSTYCLGEVGRNNIFMQGWWIYDGGQYCTTVLASDGEYLDKVTVSWDAVSGATNYPVYRATSAGGTKTLLASPATSPYDDTGATPGMTYYYWVKACNGALCSSYSAYDTGWRNLSAPTTFTASDGTYTDHVRVSWDAASGATFYEVYRADSAIGAKTLLDSPATSPYDDTSAAPAVTYYYWVKACSGLGCSDFSANDTGWRNLAAPTAVTASDGTFTDKVQITWTASTGAFSYKVYRSTSATGAKSQLGSAAASPYNDGGATPGITYYYWVVACRSPRCSDYSANDTGWRKPLAPTGVTASDGMYTDKVVISWTGSAGATSYQVYRATSAGGTKVGPSNVAGTTINDTSATPGVTYYYFVKACRGTRCSDFSAYDTGWRNLAPPTNVQASDGTYPDKVRITWKASLGATSYKLYRATSADGTKTLLGSLAGTSANDTSAVPGTTYYYWVIACRGTVCSDYSAYDSGRR
jgi:surface protein